MLEDDAFLKGPSRDLFTNSSLHKLLAALSLINTEILAPKIAFILCNLVKVLQSRDPGGALPESSSFQSGEGDHGDYNEALKFVRRHAGKHWATHTAQGSSAPTQTCISIVIPKQVCLFACLAWSCVIVSSC